METWHHGGEENEVEEVEMEVVGVNEDGAYGEAVSSVAEEEQ